MPKVIDEVVVYRATLSLFVTHGYEGTRTKEIAAVAKIHEATLFRKYGSKANLIVQAIEATLSDTPLHTVAYTGDLHADLQAIVRAYLETDTQHGAIIPMLLSQVQQYPELKAALARLGRDIEGMSAIIQRYQQQGLLKTEAPRITLSALLGPLMTRQMFRRAFVGVQPLAIDAEQVVLFFLHGHAATAEQS